MLKYAGWIWRYIPIVGNLPFATSLAHKEASKEISLTVFFAGLPLFLPLLVSLLIPDLHTAQFFGKLIGEGELFLYAASFIGPLIYSVFKDRSTEEEDVSPEETVDTSNQNSRSSARPILGLLFPDGIWFIIMSILILLVSTVAMVLIRVVPVGALLLSESRPTLRYVSELTYGLAVLCLYCASVYRNDLEKADNALRSGERAFTARWNAR